jgi:hypothetical protein
MALIVRKVDRAGDGRVDRVGLPQVIAQDHLRGFAHVEGLEIEVRFLRAGGKLLRHGLGVEELARAGEDLGLVGGRRTGGRRGVPGRDLLGGHRRGDLANVRRQRLEPGRVRLGGRFGRRAGQRPREVRAAGGRERDGEQAEAMEGDAADRFHGLLTVQFVACARRAARRRARISSGVSFEMSSLGVRRGMGAAAADGGCTVIVGWKPTGAEPGGAGGRARDGNLGRGTSTGCRRTGGRRTAEGAAGRRSGGRRLLGRGPSRRATGCSRCRCPGRGPRGVGPTSVSVRSFRRAPFCTRCTLPPETSLSIAKARSPTHRGALQHVLALLHDRGIGGRRGRRGAAARQEERAARGLGAGERFGRQREGLEQLRFHDPGRRGGAGLGRRLAEVELRADHAGEHGAGATPEGGPECSGFERNRAMVRAGSRSR